MNNITLNKIKLLEGFWKLKNELLVNELVNDIIPYQWDVLNNRIDGVPLSHSVENFKIAAGESKGEPEGTIFQDSDVGKWLEAAAYSLSFSPNKDLEKIIDDLVRLIHKSQSPNGYVNTFFAAKGIDNRWTDLVMGHEMYCAGHLIEAAVAYYNVTGKREFIDVMGKYVDLIIKEFGPEEGQIHSYDGHPEIELALYRLAEATGEEKYKKIADYFMNIRGTVKNFYNGIAAKEGMIPKSRWFQSDYYVADKPVREMEEVTGHSVRAVYLYSGLVDQYENSKEPELWKTLTKLWDNMEQKRVYITGALGSQSHGERFTVDYDLPADRGYTETCASIGLIFWAWRMLKVDLNSKYSDMIEKALYNGALGGISLNGKEYLYVNPLEIKPEVAKYRHDTEHITTHRVGWFDCACCPTNIARLIGSVGSYIYSSEMNSLYLHQFISSQVEEVIANNKVVINQKTNFPWSGDVNLNFNMEQSVEFNIYIRKPGWNSNFTILINNDEYNNYTMNNGYILINRTWSNDDLVTIKFEMLPKLMEANTKVHDHIGKVAITYGPLVYCVEEDDNGLDLQNLIIDPNGSIEVIKDDKELESSVKIILDGYKEKSHGNSLYSNYKEKELERVKIKAIPYFQWGNRTRDKEMRVWLRVK